MATTHVEDVHDVSDQELIERAHALKPLLRANAAEVDAGRRVVEENIAALEEAGLFRLAVPRRFDGFEVPFATNVQATAALAEACGSTAWVTTLINGCAWLAGLFCDRAQQDVWGENPGARVCGVLAPSATTRKVEGGWRITGAWGYASGCLHAQWAALGAPLVDESSAPVDQGLLLIPTTELEIEDTWYVAGMRGGQQHPPRQRRICAGASRDVDHPSAAGLLPDRAQG